MVEGKRRQRLTKYDAMMKKFRYGAALDAGMLVSWSLGSMVLNAGVSFADHPHPVLLLSSLSLVGDHASA